MANERFDPQMSSDKIWHGDQQERCITDDLDALEQGVADLETSKAASNHTHTGYAAAGHTHTPASIGAAAAEHTHDLSGKADLVNGVVPESQLPSYVDDVLEYATLSAFPATGQSGKVYLAQDTNKSYRWGGTQYAELNGGIALGETAATAHRGDHGKAAYDHSQNGTVHVTAEQKQAWDGKAAGDHGHPLNAIAGLLGLLPTDPTGNVKSSASTNDVLAHIAALPSGLHTVYAQASAPNAPNSVEGWRFLVHKTGSAVYGWVLAFGTNGSIYSNYLNNGTWRGWKAIYDASPAPLWTGGANNGYYMTETHTIIPNKKLSECRSGWLLLWSDHDPGGNTNNSDFCTTVIPKRAYAGQAWNGATWYCDIPTYAAAAATGSEIRVIKALKVYDDKLVGTEYNAIVNRSDVVLRAVYEF